MGRLLVILLIILCPATCIGQVQVFSGDDLVKISSLSPQSYDDYIVRKGYPIKRRNIVENSTGFSFYEKQFPGKIDSAAVNRSVDVYKKDDTWCIVLRTSSVDEFMSTRNRLKKMDFFCSSSSDTCAKTPLLFQKKTVTIQAICNTEEDGEPVYTFVIKKKDLPPPNAVRFADDLLKFDSHEFLSAYFGENNVKKDVYLFSEKESRKCSVLFPNTDEQAVFIWDDEENYRKISYVLIAGSISTPDAKKFNGNISHNKWELKNGIYQGMRISDLLRLNSNDFKFFGNQSEYSMMVEPKVTGSINFKWIGIGFNCFNCEKAAILDRQKVSASDAVNNDLAMHVSCIMISP